MSTQTPRCMPMSTVLSIVLLTGLPRIAGAATYDIGPASGTITSAGSVVTVPITLSNFVPPAPAGNGAKGFQVTVALSSGLKFAPTQPVLTGAYLTGAGACPNGGANDASPIFSVTPNTDGTTTIVAALNPGKCAQCATSAFPNGAVVFTLRLATTLASGTSTETVSLVPSPAGAVTPSPTLNDCNANQPITPLAYGVSSANVSVSLCSPTTAAPTITSATQVTTGNSNPSSGVTGIRLTWTNPPGIDPNATLDVWRAPFGFGLSGVWQRAHPEYDDDNFFLARAPDAPAGTAPVNTSAATGWSKVPANPAASALTFVDTPPQRGFWYYVVNITDACNLTQISNLSAGTLNYLLGDVTNGTTVGTGDDVVGPADVSALGSAYGAAVPNPPGAIANLDIGPTMDRTPFGRPHPDDFIGFEDLVVLSMNYNKGPSPQLSALPGPADHDELGLEAPAGVSAHEEFAVALRLRGAADLQAISAQLGWDPAVAEPIAVEPGPSAVTQDGVVLSSGPGNVDAAVLGRDRPGWSGDGVLATVRFRARSAGDPRIGIASVDARDRANQKVELSTPAAIVPLVSALAPASPNPFTGSATFHLSLARAGRVELAMFSVDGRRVKTLLAGTHPAGVYHVAWSGTDDQGRDVPPGLYFARLVTVDGRYTRTVVLRK